MLDQVSKTQLFNLYGKTYIAGPGKRTLASKWTEFYGSVSTSDTEMLGYAVYCADSSRMQELDYVQPIAVASLDELLTPEFLQSDRRQLVVVDDLEFSRIYAERYVSAEKLVGLRTETPNVALFDGLPPSRLPLELTVQLIHAGAETEQFADKYRKLLRTIALEATNSNMNGIKYILPYRPHLISELAEFLDLNNVPLKFPDSMLRFPRLARALTGSLTYADFSSDAKFLNYCRMASSLRLDDDTGGYYLDANYGAAAKVHRALDLLTSDDPVQGLLDHLYLLNGYIQYKGDRYALEWLAHHTDLSAFQAYVAQQGDENNVVSFD